MVLEVDSQPHHQIHWNKELRNTFKPTIPYIYGQLQSSCFFGNSHILKVLPPKFYL